MKPRPVTVLLTLLFAALALSLAEVRVGHAETQLAQTSDTQLAQARKKRPPLFERLFGPRKKQVTPLITRKKRAVRSSSSRKRTTTRRSPRRSAPSQTVQTAKVTPKDPDARKVLIVGDFVASGLAWGLEQQFADEPKIAIIDRSNASSGLVRADHYDWNEQLLGILNEVSPDLVVVVIGANDRQPIPVGDVSESLRSEAWEAQYGKRIDAMLETLGVFGRPFFWVSAPPLRGREATADMAYLNGVYRPRVEAAGGYFVDIWNGFTNADGQYVATGPDLDGQTRALRTSDGINFTRAGRTKLAFYVARDMRRRTGIGVGLVDLLPSTSQTSTIEIGADGKKRLVGPVISLSEPVPGNTEALAGPPAPLTFDPVSGGVRPASRPIADGDEETSRYRLIVKGEALPALPGRVDDFAWPPATRAKQGFLAPVTEDAASADAAEDPIEDS